LTPLSLELFLTLGLASYRIARFIALEDGPYAFMRRLRTKIDWHVIYCMHCMGIYVAVIVFLIYQTRFPILFWALVCLALAGVVSLIADLAVRT
jgi:hypothetical protein